MERIPFASLVEGSGWVTEKEHSTNSEKILKNFSDELFFWIYVDPIRPVGQESWTKGPTIRFIIKESQWAKIFCIKNLLSRFDQERGE